MLSQIDAQQSPALLLSPLLLLFSGQCSCTVVVPFRLSSFHGKQAAEQQQQQQQQHLALNELCPILMPYMSSVRFAIRDAPRELYYCGSVHYKQYATGWPGLLSLSVLACLCSDCFLVASLRRL